MGDYGFEPAGPDVDLFRLLSSQLLDKALDGIVGPKTLVLAADLAGPLGLVTEVGALKVHSFLLLEERR
jgi:hypothetical protein